LEDFVAVPLGTIISSMLEPEAYAGEVGDPAEFDRARSRWAPADARSIEGSDLARKAERHGWPVPRNSRGEPIAIDLRGVFLRGLNRFDDEMGDRHESEGDPNGAGRAMGIWQPDGIKAHGHPVRASRGSGAGGISSRKSGPAGTAGIEVEAGPFGGAETRPRNVAVYFYLRINK
jgi:hypothetical protein